MIVFRVFIIIPFIIIIMLLNSTIMPHKIIIMPHNIIFMLLNIRNIPINIILVPLNNLIMLHIVDMQHDKHDMHMISRIIIMLS